ncbi:MAG: CDP-alcohol phosphatidyltransferase family protein [Clostridiales bacterium]|nr:CDP-alcohol phosphatidyltransferase family protein [Clostridiales bacterium]
MSNVPDTEQKTGSKIFTIPNLLSFFRILLIPLFCWTYIGREDILWTAVIIVVSGLSDLADGYIARTFHMTSDLGKFLDPLSDKLTLAALVVCLFTRFPYMILVFALMFVKEITTSLTHLKAMKKTGKVPMALWHGKISTAGLYVVMGLHLVWPTMPEILSYTLVALIMTIMLLSFILYLVRNLRIINGK